MSSIFGTGGFNSSQVEARKDFSAVEPGDYNFQFTKFEEKPSKNKPQNRYLQLTAVGLNGKAKGRQLFVRLNLVNDNETAREIAQGELKEICEAIGKVVIHEPAQLINVPFTATLAIEPDSRGDAFPPQNVIKKYKKLVTAETLPSTEAAAPSAAAKKPWE